MRKILILGFLLVCFLSCERTIEVDHNSGLVEIESLSVKINLSEPGTLSNALSEYTGVDVESLVLSGPINGSDIIVIRRLAGVTEDGINTYGELKNLDLSKVQIIAGGDFYYQSSDGNKYTTSADVLSPFMFYNCLSLETVVLPPVKELGHSSFAECENLSSVRFTGEPTKISDYCFYECHSLSSISIPSSVRHIGDWAFYCCYNLTEVSGLEHVETMGEYIFRECDKLKSINLFPLLKVIPEGAFCMCTSLEEINLSNVDTIGDYAFYQTDNLKSVEFSKSLESIGEYAFTNPYTLPKNRGLGGDLILPPSLKYVGEAAFSQTDITSVIINSDIETSGSILYGEFYRCGNLRSLVLNSGVTKLYLSFKSCSSLESISLPSTLEHIGQVKLYENAGDVLVIADYWGIFSYCTSLKSISLPQSLKSLSVSTFSGCESLESIELPESLTAICLATFEGCTNLRTVNIPDGLRVIEGEAFKECSKLTEVVLPSALESLEYSTFEKCSSLSSITLPSGLNNIGASCFAECSNLKEIAIGDNVEVISDNCFHNCISLENIILGNSLREIRSYAFAHCPSLLQINLPSSLVEIGDKAFFRSGLSEVTVNWQFPISVTTTAFDEDLIKNAKLFVPANTIDLYQQTTPWNLFGLILER